MLIAVLFAIAKCGSSPSVHQQINKMDKQNVVHPCNEFSLKKAWNSDTCYSLDEPWKHARTSLVVVWTRMRLSMQGMQVQSLLQEDPTRCGAAKPVYHNYWACTLEPESHSHWAQVLPLLKHRCARQQEKPSQWEAHTPQLDGSPCSLQLQKAHTQQGGPSTAKSK